MPSTYHTYLVTAVDQRVETKVLSDRAFEPGVTEQLVASSLTKFYDEHIKDKPGGKGFPTLKNWCNVEPPGTEKIIGGVKWRFHILKEPPPPPDQVGVRR